MANKGIYEMTDTWNNGGTTYYGIKMNVTNSASAADSELITMQIAGDDVFVVDKFGNLALTSTDAGATAAPVVTLYRNSASPAASDIIGKILFQGEDSAGNTEDYAEIYATIADPTSTSEDAGFALRGKVAGSMTTMLSITGTLVTFGSTISDATKFGDAADPTKSFRIDGGNITPGQTRVLASPDASGLILVDSKLALGQCRLALDGGNLKLSRYGGIYITINGAAYEIPSAGVTLSASGLTPGALYYIYA